MPPDETSRLLLELRDATAALRAATVAQGETVSLLKWIIVGESTAFVATCGFFVAWVRTLYGDRIDSEAKRTEERDKALVVRDALIGRVATMVERMDETVRAVYKMKRRGGS